MAARTRVKLCGLRTAAEAELASELGVDFIGLVFAEKSKRRLKVEEARKIVSALGRRPAPARHLVHEGIPSGGWFERCAAGFDTLLDGGTPLVVGVFVDQPPSLVNAIADTLSLDAVQLSGHEPAEQALELRRPVIRSMHIGPDTSAGDVLKGCEVGTAALCLLDTAIPGEAGGTGQAFDWSVAALVSSQRPCMLAGGLSPHNVVQAIASVRPWAVDVSSGIETDGIKDQAKMRAFVQAVHEGDALLFKSGQNEV